jgi:selenocysteine lyase/cysteine desulfurase
VAKLVHKKQTELFLQQEAYPDTWFRKQMYDLIYDSRALIANFIQATVSDTVLVENASSAVNSILRSQQFEKGDKVIRLDTSYNMVIRTLDYLTETIGIEVK